MKIYIHHLGSYGEDPFLTYRSSFIATNLDNGDRLHVVEGDLQQFLIDNSDFQEYYVANWYQNLYPDAPGDTPLEKYLNAMNNVFETNPPKWYNILPALANSSLFTKLLTTKNSNAFSALQTVVQYRNMDLFLSLATATLEGIPGGLSEEEMNDLNLILSENNFPILD